MPNNKSHGSPYKMKAGKMGPMQKNFGPELAINKKLDKKSMEGGMTGQPGKTLDGPLAKKSPIYKKKGGVTPTNKTATTRKKNAGPLGGKAKRDSMLSDTNNDGNMITRGFAKAAANRKAAKAKSTAKKLNKKNTVFNNAKTETNLKKNKELKINKELMSKKVKKEKTGYENATSVNAMVTQRTKFRADPKNKGKKYPGQAEINKRLKKDPKKFD